MQEKQFVVTQRCSEGKMTGAVRREQAEFSMDYVNLPEPPVTTAAGGGDEGNHPAPGTKLLRLVGVSFGLLCLLQAAVNVSLRLTLFKSDGQTSPTGPACCNETDKQRQLIERYIQQGWVRFRSSVYYISDARNTWQQSRRYCLRQGADLVIINTKEEQDFTRQFHRFTWLGLYYESKTKKWIWVDRTPLNESFSFWGPGEPNGFEGKIENCVEIRFFEMDNSWNDIPCGDQNYWICEKEVAP
ncbi:C-type lectin domain family 4 member E-like [Gambusia affinis]|uniref:C-type lectin domain family 4 member E-like n=1 Tax=Gambusia affinis TaxID=33528 RepID=UPI000F334B1F|nr:C-type lectin domain family 4 member E-like [Gambusia affinis]